MDVSKWTSRARQTQLLIPHYALLRSLTSSSSAQVSGPELRALVELTFESDALAAATADYMVATLAARPSPLVLLKTSKSLDLAAKESSKAFRARLREDDAVISGCIGVNVAGGDEFELEAQQRLTNLRQFLFSDEALSLDQEMEHSDNKGPTKKFGFSGMGSTSGSGGGKLGFGNDATTSSPSMRSKMLGFLEKSLESSTADPKSLGKDLLKSSPNRFEPIKINFGLKSEIHRHKSTEVRNESQKELANPMIKSTYKPGRAGGGWDDSEESDNETILPKQAEKEVETEDLLNLATIDDQKDSEDLDKRTQVVRDFLANQSTLTPRAIKSFMSEQRVSPETFCHLLASSALLSSDQERLGVLVLLEERFRLQSLSSEQLTAIEAALKDLKGRFAEKENDLLECKTVKISNILRVMQSAQS